MNDLEPGDMRGKVPQPFPTNNAALAATLNMCGVRHPVTAGVIHAGFNLYTVEFLRTFPKLKGMKTEDAIRDLWYMGTPGNVVYCFERDDKFNEIIGGWNEMGDALTKAASANPDAHTATLNVECSLKDIGKISRQLSQARKEFFGYKNVTPLWRRRHANGSLYIPAARAKTEGRVERDGPKMTIIGNGNYHSVDIPALPKRP